MKNRFKLPTKSNLKNRTSTISNAFAIAITPYIRPKDVEMDRFLEELQLKNGQCAYCLGKANAMDHVKPLVTNGLPTGYITEIRNLVPCCSACNSAKGAQEFKTWYKSKKNIEQLNRYYGSKNCFKDKEYFEKCKIKNIKAGVLSEDAVWNLDETVKDIFDRMKKIVK